MRGAPRTPILLASSAIACALICMVVQLTAVDVIFSLPLVLYLPGAGVVGAARGGSARKVLGEDLWWSVLGSIGFTILGGLILNVAGGLTQSTWLLYLVCLTVVASGVAWWRLARVVGPVPSPHQGRNSRRVSLRTGLLVGAAGLLVAAAVGISVYSSDTANQENFVQLWILPSPLAAGDYAGHVQVGIENHEGRTATFDVVVSGSNGQVLATKEVELNESGVWTLQLARPKHQTVTATVALSTDPSHALSSVHLSKAA